MVPSDSPRVSVVIPCFNYGRFLKPCLDSVACQTLKPIETLIIDDGSTDPHTLSILHDLAQTGSKIIRQANRGVAAARNTGIRHAQGEYVYFLDADDVLFPECLEKLSGMLEHNADAIAACCGVRLLEGDREGTEWHASHYPYLVLVENTWAAGLMLRKRSVEEFSLWYDEPMRSGYEDWEFNIRLAQTGRPIMVHPAPLYHYRIHSKSMQASARQRHAELVEYIRRKHWRLFTPENLQKLKRLHFPALAVAVNGAERLEMESWLARQTFKDMVASEAADAGHLHPYRMLHAGPAACRRLPPEAIESAIMFLESNKQEARCVLAVRLDENLYSAIDNRTREICQPVAMVLKAEAFAAGLDAGSRSDHLENVICFSDQIPGSTSGWTPCQFNVGIKRKWHFRDPVSLRKLLSSSIEKLFGARIKGYLASCYDFVYYRFLFSDRLFSIRNRIAATVGERCEILLSRIIYAAFLARPVSRDDQPSPTPSCQKSRNLSPLFLDTDNHNATQTTVLIVTAWLHHGGVEREILDLCTYLDRSRFKVIVTTTRHSRHPWENVFRSTGASIYHLAQFFSPHEIYRGLAHLILQHGVNVMHIVHSREAYVSLPLIRRVCPFLAVCDRNVTLAGGFPKISARFGRGLIDLRTVGHQKLARQISELYGLGRENLKVIYAGTDIGRLQQQSSAKPGLLHTLCRVPDDVPIVLYLGRLDREKRPDVFARVAARICKTRPGSSVHFAMAGDGEMRGELEALIAKLGVRDRIHLLGFQQNSHELLRESTILMITSRYEGLALVSFEAMALGTPQISADVGGQSELITPDIGILVQNGIGEIDRYTRACVELLDDHERRKQMSIASKRKYTTKYTATYCTDQYGRIFEDLAELSRRRSHEMLHLRPPHINPLTDLA